MAFDAAGRVLVTGTWNQDSFSTPYAVTIRYSAAGDPLDTIYGTVGGRDIAVDPEGRIFTAGTSIARLDSGLHLVWIHQPFNKPCELYAGIKLTAAGDVVVAGSVNSGDSTDWDCVAAQYRPNGTPVWEKTYSSQGAEYDRFLCVATDDAGNVYAGGYLRAPYPSVNENMLVVKHDSTGNQKWAWTVSTGDNNQDAVVGIAADGYGGAYFTAQGDGIWRDLFLARIGADGETLWTRRVSEGTSKAIAVDSAGYVYVVGESVVGYLSSEVVVLKYDSLGELQWVRMMEGTGRYWDCGTQVAVTGSGSLVVAGYFNYPFQRGVVAQFNLEGDLLGRFVYDDYFMPLAMTVGPGNAIAVTGTAEYYAGPMVTMNCTYAPAVTEGPADLTVSSLRVNPSPAVDVVDIVLTGPDVRAIRVYDVRGSLVRVLPVSARAQPQAVARWDGRDQQGRSVPAGPYYLRTVGTGRARTARAILVR